MIGIIDYGAGNLASVRHAFERVGVDAEPFDDPSRIAAFDRIVLPGVGSFRLAMKTLASRGWPDAIRDVVAEGRPLLGICLGMQLLLEQGTEHGETHGLGFVRGTVVPLTPAPSHKVPHVGWNRLFHKRPHPVFEGVKEHVDFYFVHSYACVPELDEDVLSESDHGGRFVAGVARGAVVGLQFHPEKSQPMGLRILQNFADWDGSW